MTDWTNWSIDHTGSKPIKSPCNTTSGTFIESGIRCSNIMSILRDKTHTRPLLKGRNTLAIFHGILQMKALKKGKHSHRVISYLYIYLGNLLFSRTQRYRVDTPFNIFESSPAAYDGYRQGNPLRGIPWPKNDFSILAFSYLFCFCFSK